MHYLTLFWLWICSIPAWLDVHPTIVALIVVPLVTGAVSAVAKPRTPEQFAKMPFVVAQILRLWAAVFPDPAKAVAILVALITRRAPSPDTVTTGKLPPDPPSGPGMGGGLVMALLFVVGFLGAPRVLVACSPAASPTAARDTTRAVVLTVAEGVKVADHLCAQVAIAKHDKATAVACAHAYDVARPALIAAQYGIDAWDSGGSKDVPCAILDASKALRAVGDAVKAAGATVPAVALDALSLAEGYGDAACEAKPTPAPIPAAGDAASPYLDLPDASESASVDAALLPDGGAVLVIPPLDAAAEVGGDL